MNFQFDSAIIIILARKTNNYSSSVEQEAGSSLWEIISTHWNSWRSLPTRDSKFLLQSTTHRPGHCDSPGTVDISRRNSKECKPISSDRVHGSRWTRRGHRLSIHRWSGRFDLGFDLRKYRIESFERVDLDTDSLILLSISVKWIISDRTIESQILISKVVLRFLVRVVERSIKFIRRWDHRAVVMFLSEWIFSLHDYMLVNWCRKRRGYCLFRLSKLDIRHQCTKHADWTVFGGVHWMKLSALNWVLLKSPLGKISVFSAKDNSIRWVCLWIFNYAAYKQQSITRLPFVIFFECSASPTGRLLEHPLIDSFSIEK